MRLLITTLNLLSKEKLKDISPKYDVSSDEKTKEKFEACPENIRVAREAPWANLEMEESVADRLMTLGSTSVPQKDESKGELDNQCERPVQETLAVLSDGKFEKSLERESQSADIVVEDLLSGQDKNLNNGLLGNSSYMNTDEHAVVPVQTEVNPVHEEKSKEQIEFCVSFDEHLKTYGARMRCIGSSPGFPHKSAGAVRDVMRSFNCFGWKPWVVFFHGGSGDPSWRRKHELDVYLEAVEEWHQALFGRDLTTEEELLKLKHSIDKSRVRLNALVEETCARLE